MPLEPISFNWFLAIFVNTLPLEVIARGLAVCCERSLTRATCCDLQTALHVWDVLFSEGVKVLFRVGLTLLKLHEKAMVKAKDFDEVIQILTAFSQAHVDSDRFVSVR